MSERERERVGLVDSRAALLSFARTLQMNDCSSMSFSLPMSQQQQHQRLHSHSHSGDGRRERDREKRGQSTTNLNNGRRKERVRRRNSPTTSRTSGSCLVSLFPFHSAIRRFIHLLLKEPYALVTLRALLPLLFDGRIVYILPLMTQSALEK